MGLEPTSRQPLFPTLEACIWVLLDFRGCLYYLVERPGTLTSGVTLLLLFEFV